jgi:hypothetical protein
LHIVDAPTELGFTRVRQYQSSKSATADLDGAGPESRDNRRKTIAEADKVSRYQRFVVPAKAGI